MKLFDRRLKPRLITLTIALFVIILVYAIMCASTGVDPFKSSYPSYSLQAQAWLRGETKLDRNYEYLELAVYEGDYYVSFPPVPGIPNFIWLLLFGGTSAPGGLFQKLYVTFACLLIISELMRTKRMPLSHGLCWGIAFCFASAMLPVTLVGGVWYEAQTLAFMFSVCAVIAMRRNHPTRSCICYALAIGCRPFSICLGPVLMALYIRLNRIPGKAKAFKKLIPGLLAGIAIACAYCWYNYIRFGNPLEFGHSYLPEFQRAANGQFSFAYIPDNIKTVLFGSPFIKVDGKVQLQMFGFSMFLSNPVLICGVVWMIQDLLRHRMTPVKYSILAMGSINLLLLLMHRTAGGMQFGLRYALELVPFSLAWYLASPDRRRMQMWECSLMVFGLVFNILGGILVHA